MQTKHTEYNIGIYCLINTLNNKMYIGQSSNIKKRIAKHFYNLKNNKHFNVHLQDAYNKYGSTVFIHQILEECKKDNLNDREIYWITEKQTNNEKFGYNFSSGGGSGRTHSKETKQRLRVINLGKKHSVETIEKCRLSNINRDNSYLSEKRGAMNPITIAKRTNKIIGQKRSTEARKRISESHIGLTYPNRKKTSEETKEKQRLSHLGKKISDETKLKMKLSQQKRRKYENH